MKCFAFALLFPLFAQATELNLSNTPVVAWPQLSGVNDVSFVDPQFDKAFAGNGFLIERQGKVFAVTAKHVLLLARSTDMKTISITGHVKEWKIHPNRNDAEYITLGNLLNEDKSEALTPAVIETDWLVFEVLENHSKIVPLSLRTSEPKIGEALFVAGCTYKTEKECVQNGYAGKYAGSTKTNILLDLDKTDLTTLGGLSGSPVVDQHGLVVGIVSNIIPNPKGSGDIFAPANTNYLRSILDGAK